VYRSRRRPPCCWFNVPVCVQKQKKTSVLLVQCSSENGPQLAAAVTDAQGSEESRAKALGQLAVIVEHVVFELTDILVRILSLAPPCG